MTFSINKKIFEQFPSLSLGVVVARGINNAGTSPEVISLLTQETSRIRAEYQIDALKDQPKLQVWRDAYRLFGAKKYTCSVENLYRMVVEGVELRTINTLVDLYNYISLKYMVPVGGDDLDKIDGDITLRLAIGDEQFIKLNADQIDHPKVGEVIYTDEKEVLCRRWNWRECDKTKMTEATTNAMLVVEGLSPVEKEDVQKITDELSQLIQQYCEGGITTAVLDHNTLHTTL